MIEKITAIRNNISYVNDVYPVCLFLFMNSSQYMNVIWQLSNYVNFMNEHKQNKSLRRYGYIPSYINKVITSSLLSVKISTRSLAPARISAYARRPP